MNRVTQGVSGLAVGGTFGIMSQDRSDLDWGHSCQIKVPPTPT